LPDATYQLERWNLTELVPSTAGPELDKALADFESRVTALEAWRGRLSAGMAAADFVAALRDYEAVQAADHRLGYFAFLWFAEDTQSSAALSFKSKIENLSAEARNRTLFFTLWWKTLGDEAAARLMQAAEQAAGLGYFLEELRHFKPYTLSELEERIINLKDVTGAGALNTLYDMITNRFVFNLQVNGETKHLTRDQLGAYVQGPDPALRAQAYQELYRVYGEHAPILAQVYHYLVTDWRNENVGLRRFGSPMAVRNLANDIPDAVVDTLLEVCRANAGLFQRYFRLKARWLGLPEGKLRRYDIYAPLLRAEKDYAYPDAVEAVLGALGDFSPQVSGLARRVFDEHHLDGEIRPGKMGGAFCAGPLPDLTPWVLVNYTGKARDVATLAHELGHAIHGMLAGGHSVLNFHASLPLAETASVFAEILLVERLLKHETDRQVRRDLLAKSLDDAYATVQRQAYFALFEKEAHNLVQQGRTAEEIADRYLEQLREQFGDAVEVSDEFRWEWVSIPHIYGSPFYVYAYAFGQLLVLALYQMYQREGEAFKPKYLKILAYGGSQAPARILGEAGIDIASPEFWQGGFEVIKGMMDDLEAMEE
jgi:oligoendopeptidase F